MAEQDEKTTQDWTYQDLYQALMDDPDWDAPPEEREMDLMMLDWTLLSL